MNPDPDPSRSVHPRPDRSRVDRSLADRSRVDRSLADRSRVDRSLADRSRPDRSRGTPGAVRLLVAVGVAVGLTACSPAADPTPTPSDSAEPEASTAPPDPAPAESVPTPDEHSAVGELAEGFPTDLLPLPEDAEILVSTYAPQGDPGAGQPHDVSLNLRTGLPVAEVAALYRAALTAAGFTETAGTPTGGLAAESTYSRSAGDELLTVGVLDRDGARTVTVGGQVRASG